MSPHQEQPIVIPALPALDDAIAEADRALHRVTIAAHALEAAPEVGADPDDIRAALWEAAEDLRSHASVLSAIIRNGRSVRS